ncbi:MAG: glycosyltransferase family 4 protein, partial [Planctomycetes bacterium]|nr:glycosyltransferase family 4 protein [Planctomycetota bacterium]
ADAPIAEQTGVPRVAIVGNSFQPYRIYLHRRLLAEVPEIELWSLATHGNSYGRWSTLEIPPEIRPVDFGHCEPNNEQAELRFSAREWRKGGRIIRWLQQHNVAAVICYGCGDVGRLRILRWCHAHSIPCFLTGDFNIRGDRYTGWKRLAKTIVYEKAVEWSYGLMPCGIYGRDLLMRYGGGGKPHFLFPFVPNIELFENPPQGAIERARQRVGVDARRRRLLFSARMMRAKRPDLAIQAFTAIALERPEWDLVMAGDGMLRGEIEASVPSDLRHRIFWTGFIHDVGDLAGLYAECDVLVLPADKEPWGMVVIEAAAAGMALVVTDVVGASPELVRDGDNGQTFPRGDLPALIAALREVTHPANIDAMKQKSPRVLDRWLSASDPVEGFRAALASCGLVPCRRERSGTAAESSKGRNAAHVDNGDIGLTNQFETITQASG